MEKGEKFILFFFLSPQKGNDRSIKWRYLKPDTYIQTWIMQILKRFRHMMLEHSESKVGKTNTHDECCIFNVS